ncbi:MAG TPA: hypothetical protein VMP68_14500 [Candidatus Eisenbacteria bacterium]|nr:hypothetical protein [Candidatus Eisenbacteria bacterium]
MWTKSEVTLGDGMQMVNGRVQRVTPQTVPSYTFTCKCGTTCTVLVQNPKAPVRVWCCGVYHSPRPETQKQSLLTRLLSFAI